ncbi:MAG: hypothetical protein EGP69_07165 [[Ruminococcus] faecis]|nr:hypothetical protein [Mediterraneibacter faecis]
MLLKYVTYNIISNLFYYYLLYITFYSKMVTVQSQAKFHKTDVKCLHFKTVFEILFGGYATPTKCVAFWKLALNSYIKRKDIIKIL